MPSSPTFAVVDQFDEDEFLDVPKARVAPLAALNTVPRSPETSGPRHLLPGILAIAACAVMAGARCFQRGRARRVLGVADRSGRSDHGWSATSRFAIYLASNDGYEDSRPAHRCFAGAPEDALDTACGLYLGDPTAWI